MPLDKVHKKLYVDGTDSANPIGISPWDVAQCLGDYRNTESGRDIGMLCTSSHINKFAICKPKSKYHPYPFGLMLNYLEYVPSGVGYTYIRPGTDEDKILEEFDGYVHEGTSDLDFNMEFYSDQFSFPLFDDDRLYCSEEYVDYPGLIVKTKPATEGILCFKNIPELINGNGGNGQRITVDIAMYNPSGDRWWFGYLALSPYVDELPEFIIIPPESLDEIGRGSEIKLFWQVTQRDNSQVWNMISPMGFALIENLRGFIDICSTDISNSTILEVQDSMGNVILTTLLGSLSYATITIPYQGKLVIKDITTTNLSSKTVYASYGLECNGSHGTFTPSVEILAGKSVVHSIEMPWRYFGSLMFGIYDESPVLLEGITLPVLDTSLGSESYETIYEFSSTKIIVAQSS